MYRIFLELEHFVTVTFALFLLMIILSCLWYIFWIIKLKNFPWLKIVFEKQFLIFCYTKISSQIMPFSSPEKSFMHIVHHWIV